MAFVNNNQFNNTREEGFTYWQAYAGNPSYPLLKYNFQTNSQMLLYNNNNQIMFSVTGNNGLRFYNNNVQTMEITPTGTLNLSGNINSVNANIQQTLTTNNINLGTYGTLRIHFESQNEIDFINNIQYTGANNNGYSFYQAYAGNPSYPLFKFNFKNNSQMLLYNNNNEIMFSVTGNNGLRFYNNNVQTMEITPTGTLNLSSDINSVNANIQQTLTTNNIICNGTIENNSAFKTYQNQIYSAPLQPKTSGTIDVLVASFVIKSNYNKQITISSPISLYRSFNNNSANSQLSNRIYDTLSSVTYKVMKNDVLFNSGTCTYSDTIPKTVYLVKASSTSTTNYECYMTNAITSFTPSDESVPNGNEYKILYTINYGQNTSWQSYNLNMLAFEYRINTDVSSCNLTLTLVSGPDTYQNYGANYASVNYNVSRNTDSFSGIGELKLNDLASNNIYNQNTITSYTINSTNLNASNTITSQSLNCKYSTIDTYFTARNITAAYLIDGSVSSRPVMYPIICSIKQLNPNDTDDSYIVNAGYKIITYYDSNYLGTSNTYDNTNGATISKYNIIAPNQTSSLRVYFLNQEITLPDIS